MSPQVCTYRGKFMGEYFTGGRPVRFCDRLFYCASLCKNVALWSGEESQAKQSIPRPSRKSNRRTLRKLLRNS